MSAPRSHAVVSAATRSECTVRWVEYTAAGVAFDEVLDSPHRKRSSSKAVVAFSPCGEGRAKEGTTTLNSFSPYFVCSTPVYRFSHGDRGLKRVVNGVGKWLTCESCGYVGGCRCLKSFSGSSQPIRSTANQCCIIRSCIRNESTLKLMLTRSTIRVTMQKVR